jgi:hypothetical protein
VWTNYVRSLKTARDGEKESKAQLEEAISKLQRAVLVKVASLAAEDIVSVNAFDDHQQEVAADDDDVEEGSDDDDEEMGEDRIARISRDVMKNFTRDFNGKSGSFVGEMVEIGRSHYSRNVYTYIYHITPRTCVSPLSVSPLHVHTANVYL